LLLIFETASNESDEYQTANKSNVLQKGSESI
jgi:hypothetical protein